ncbi:MAG: hypothetical protein Q7T56_13070 [Nocardioidaceae bacterium]|nr:hypothetical protein [Nocardioidaceae bacterium]
MSRNPRLDRRQLLSLLAVTAVAGCSSGGGDESAPQGTDPSDAASPSESAAPSTTGTASPAVAGVVASGITTPWGLTFLASGDALVSERDTGRVIRVSAEGDKSPVGTVDGVTTTPARAASSGWCSPPTSPSSTPTTPARATTASCG